MAQSLEILETNNVSPPSGSVPPTTLPLISFFDIPWFHSPPMHSIFFYHYPNPTSHFIETTLPVIKHSLSQTLQHFFPLAGTIVCPLSPEKPEIRYAEGDSVSLTVAKSTEDFDLLTSNNSSRDVKLLQPFVPQIPPLRVLSDGTQVIPIMALQVTVFPDVGICVGVSHHHMAADGISLMHFMRSWASVCKSQGDLELSCHDVKSLPDNKSREMIKDVYGCDPIYLNEYWKWVSSPRMMSPIQNHEGKKKPTMVQSTFAITRDQTDKLKQFVKTQCDDNIHVSSFIVTCAFMWVCMIQSESEEDEINVSANDNDGYYYFIFAVDCRGRVNEFPLPSTYFGNCTAPGIVRVKKSELLGRNGIFAAVKAIGKKVREMDGGNVLKGAEGWLSELGEMFMSGHIVSVSGSPKMRIYDVDFGWGKPENVEFVHLGSGGILGISEAPNDKKGGIQVMLALNVKQMDQFSTKFESNLNMLH